MPEPPRLPCPRPARAALAGRYVRLEPIDVRTHAADLYAAFSGPDADERHRFLSDLPPSSLQAMQQWIDAAVARDDPLMFAAVDASTGRALGRQSLLRIVPEHGVIEVGHILWSAAMARTRLATESIYLLMRCSFDELGYRRFEWKCNNRNEGSKRAALRFGFQFEGVFRQHMWIRGVNRDTAWFAMLDHDWDSTWRGAFERWLEPDNFDAQGAQRRRLADCVG
jgi:RimJ/RimL family protein N-acetyltransferase